MNLEAFYIALRRRESGVFGTSLSRKQVDGCEAILGECIRLQADLGQTAYILATAYGETGGKMQPVAENLYYRAARITQVFGRARLQGISPHTLAGNPQLLANTVYGGKWGALNLGNTERGDGWRFRGQGIGQITGRRNFTLWGERMGVDLVSNPDMMMDLEISVRALVQPMLEGWATGQKLSEYVVGASRDYIRARRVWNGDFDAKKYADWAVSFERALAEAGYNHRTPPTRPAAPTPDAPPTIDTQPPAKGLWALVAAFLKLFGGKT